MNMIELVTKFRFTIMRLGRSSFNHTSLAVMDFPSACCDDASILLAEFLEENGYININLIHGSNGGVQKELKSHDWLLVGSIIVDITADQFDFKGYINALVIVERESAFHDTFDQVNRGRALDSERSMQRRGEFRTAYSVIKRALAEKNIAQV
jgi:hypothetical protein